MGLKHRSMWHVSVVRHKGAESMLCILELILFLCLASQQRDERGQLILRRSNRNGRLFRLLKVQTRCDSSEEKQVCLALGAWVRRRTGGHLTNPGEGRWEHQLFNRPGINIRSSATQGMASTVWRVYAVHPPQIWSQVVTTRGVAKHCVAATVGKTVFSGQEMHASASA